VSAAGSVDETGGQPETRETGGQLEIRVVCVTYNSGAVLGTFVDSLRHATTRPYELVLADNGSSDGAPEREVARSGARLVPTGGNLGYGRAANLGAQGFTGPWLVVANPDIEWTHGALDELIDASARWARPGALGPLILEPDGSTYPSGRALPSFRTGAGHALFAKVWPLNPWTARYQSQQELTAAVERTCGWLSGSCLLLRTEAFRGVGGFDPGYFMFFEDVDLGDRLARAGWQSVYVPRARVIHLGGHSWRSAPEAMIRAHHRSALRYLTGRYGAWYLAPLRLAIRVGLAARQWWEVRRARGGGRLRP
jgi:N-acetylglucosaminyl-diphospho-decaprenol L-rhamnosyltransferase